MHVMSKRARSPEDIIDDACTAPSSKKQRLNPDQEGNGYHHQGTNGTKLKQEHLDTAAWGIDDDSDDSDEDDDHANNNNNNNHQTTQLHNNNNNNNNGIGIGTTTTTTSASSTSDHTRPAYESNTFQISSTAQKMMKSMGYKQGDALGKAGDGITEPIQAYERIATHAGLGYDANLTIKPQKHVYEAEPIEIEVKPRWYTQMADDVTLLSAKEFESFLSFKPRVDFVGVEWCDAFGSRELQAEIFARKSDFDFLAEQQSKNKRFLGARNKANPFEGIKREIFQNRAALKMCEIDRHLHYLITQPYNGGCVTFEKGSKQRQERMLHDWKNGDVDEISLHRRDNWSRELLYFADLCSGPGGFTEYFLHINKWQCRGFGFTLKGSEDFRLNKFNSNAPWDQFTPLYGANNTGDITLNENLISFRNKVLATATTGCHAVMADGGFDCHPNYNSQELLSRQLILCQCCCAMSILGKKGNFVCKLFDCFHPFTASLLFVMCMCFDEVALIKPNQSRPANSERYLICKGYKFGECNVYERSKTNKSVHDAHYTVTHLLDVNMIINKQKHDKAAVDVLVDRLQRMQMQIETMQATEQQQQQQPPEDEHKSMHNDSHNQHNQGQNMPSAADVEALQTELDAKRSKLREVCPLVPVEAMPPSFVAWLKQFNEENGARQVRHLERIKKYLEDQSLPIDDQITIREKAVRHWFHTPDGDQFVVLDAQFGSRYVTKYEDYDYNYDEQQQHSHDNNGHHHHGGGGGGSSSSSSSYQRPLRSLITNKELLARIEFEYKHCQSSVLRSEFEAQSDFQRYNIRGDWFAIAFEFKDDDDKYPPKWVTLISTGNRQIFECTRDSEQLMCVSKTNELMKLPADTVVDCIKQHSCKTNQEIYSIFDCWVIGSKSLYKRNFVQRQEFCRILYQNYGSKYLKFAGAMPAAQSIDRPQIQLKSSNIYLWLIRNKKSPEQKEAHNPATKQLSCYWRPCHVKLWNGKQSNCIPMHSLVRNIKQLESAQLKQRQQMLRRNKTQN